MLKHWSFMKSPDLLRLNAVNQEGITACPFKFVPLVTIFFSFYKKSPYKSTDFSKLFKYIKYLKCI
jgi:hypothetical protein